jgi:surface antigen
VSQTRIALVVLFFAALLVPTAPAQASYTVLCTTYSGCSGKGYSHAGYASAKDTSYWNMYTGTNCTNYVAYRLITTNGMSTKRPAPGVGNARDWGKAMASVTDAKPAVGAVAWWGKTGNHVAYIEKVVSADEIWVSESNWSGAFDWRRITKDGKGWPDGFIHFTPPAPASTGRPGIVGVPTVGTAVTAAVGTWSPAPDTYSYQWMIDGVAIAGATAKTFTPTSSMPGRALTVQVTGTRAGAPAVRTVSPPAVVSPGTLTSSSRPVVSGTAKVGQKLTATPGTWSRKSVTVTYQWFSGATAVDGATGSTYVARSSDAGRPLAVRVTGSRTGFTTATSTSTPTAAVAAGTLTRKAGPTVQGAPRVGSPLTATPGTWSPAATPSYQWYAGTRAVAGATAATFTPSASERGATIRVRVTARRAGFTTTTATSASTAAVATGRIAVSSAPRITGSAAVGSVLTVSPGTYSPAKASVRYQWLRDGKAVSGATSRTRKVSAKDVGRRLSAVVTYKATGYTATSATTPATRRTRTTPTVSVKAVATAGTVAFTVSVKAAGVATPTGTVTVVDPAGRSRAVTLVKGRATVSLTRQPTGRQSYRVRFGGTSSLAAVELAKIVTVR